MLPDFNSRSQESSPISFVIEYFGWMVVDGGVVASSWSSSSRNLHLVQATTKVTCRRDCVTYLLAIEVIATESFAAPKT